MGDRGTDWKREEAAGGGCRGVPRRPVLRADPGAPAALWSRRGRRSPAFSDGCEVGAGLEGPLELAEFVALGLQTLENAGLDVVAHGRRATEDPEVVPPRVPDDGVLVVGSESDDPVVPPPRRARRRSPPASRSCSARPPGRGPPRWLPRTCKEHVLLHRRQVAGARAGPRPRAFNPKGAWAPRRPGTGQAGASVASSPLPVPSRTLANLFNEAALLRSELRTRR